MATGREVFRCRTVNGPAVGAVAAAAEVAEEEVEVDDWTMSTGIAEVGIRRRRRAIGTAAPVPRPTVPECQHMGMVKAEANNTIHRKPFTKNDTPASIDHPNRRHNHKPIRFNFTPNPTQKKNTQTHSQQNANIHKRGVLVFRACFIQRELSNKKTRLDDFVCGCFVVREQKREENTLTQKYTQTPKY